MGDGYSSNGSIVKLSTAMLPLSDNVSATHRFPPEELYGLEKALRRIIRSSDLHSRALTRTIGLTGPQLAVLRAIAALGEVTTTALSAEVELSPATVITILDKLEARSIIERYRSASDRRIVHGRLTDKGLRIMTAVPQPLGESFSARFAALAPERRREILQAFITVADMMERETPEAERCVTEK